MIVSVTSRSLNCRSDARPELTLLRACATLVLSPERRQSIQELVQTNLDWCYVLKAAVQHRMVPMLYQGLYQTCPEAIPPDIEQYLNRHCQVNTLKNLFFDRKCQEILAWFEAAHIPAIAYKGPTLAKVAYGNLALRQFTDLDLLVRSQDFEAAQQLLAEKAYAPLIDLGWEVHCISPDKQVSVDLHRSLVPDFFGLPANFIDPSQGALSPETWLLLLAIQLGKDCCHWKVCLGQICDIAALLQTYPDLDFDQVVQRAKQLGCMRFLGIALILVQDFLHIDLPTHIQAYLSQLAIERKLAAWVSCKIEKETDSPTIVPDDAGFWYFLRIYNHRFYLQVRERPQDKLLYCAHWAWKIVRMSLRPNDADYAVISLPPYLHFLYVLIHMSRLILKYGRK